MLPELKVLTVREAADIMKITEDGMRTELESGGVKGFYIAGEWRTTEEALRERISAGAPPSNLPSLGANAPLSIVEPQWESVGEFTWNAPAGKEYFTEGYQTVLSISGRTVPLVIGYTIRPAYGADRARISVLWGHPRGALYAVVEFVGTDDYETSGKVASIIRNANNKHVRPGDDLPVGYESLPVGIFDEHITGAYSPHSMALIVDKSDRDVMVRHTVLRSLAKGWVPR